MQLFAPLNSEPTPELQRVEIASSFQLPGFHIIGLPSPEVSEARERIRAAMESCGFQLPRRRVVLNLAPASIRKRGTGLDLAMALAVLSLELREKRDDWVAAWGEVGLDGAVKPAGQLTRSVYAAWQGGVSKLFVCAEEYPSALRAIHWIEKAGFFSSGPPHLIPVESLRDAWEKIQETHAPVRNAPAPVPELHEPEPSSGLLPLSPSLERPICVAALGSHNLLLLGPKGTGKSHALDWLIALQPEISPRMRINHLLLSELAQARATADFSTPVRRVSSGVRASALVGSIGSGMLRPGEFSLANGGVLIADEFPEWSRDSREALREPLERGVVTVTRAKTSIEFPARFSFAANGNLCPCGGWPAEFPFPMEAQGQVAAKIPRCRCTHGQRRLYISRMSGPILDRMDLVLLVGANPVRPGTCDSRERFAMVREQVEFARLQAIDTWGSVPSLLTPADLEALLSARPAWQKSLEQLQILSLRSRHKTIRVALSLAAWDATGEPLPAHFMEASCYRPERFGLCD